MMDPVCSECGEPLTPNSAVYDDYGTPKWYCTTRDCPENPVNVVEDTIHD